MMNDVLNRHPDLLRLSPSDDDCIKSNSNLIYASATAAAAAGYTNRSRRATITRTQPRCPSSTGFHWSRFRRSLSIGSIRSSVFANWNPLLGLLRLPTAREIFGRKEVQIREVVRQTITKHNSELKMGSFIDAKPELTKIYQQKQQFISSSIPAILQNELNGHWPVWQGPNRLEHWRR